MGTLYIDRRSSRIEFDRGALSVREPDAPPRSVPLSLIERVVVIGNAEVTGSALTRLADNGSAVVFMPGRGQRRSAFLLSEGHGDVIRRLGQYRLASESGLRIPWAARIVRLRLTGQQRLLRAARQYRPDNRAALLRGEGAIRAGRRRVVTETMAGERLRGVEGAATAAFFRSYKTLFPAAAGFEGRNRRPPRDAVNAALSLGYTLSHGDALRSIVAHGLEPAIGFYHQPAWTRESLACDLVELVRARVERFVWRAFAERVVSVDSFTRSGEGVRLSKSARARFFSAWEQQAAPHRRWLNRAARALTRDCSHAGHQAVSAISSYEYRN